MKNCILVFLLFTFYTGVKAQNENSYTYYISMRGYQNFNGTIDAIIENSEKGEYYICDENGLEIVVSDKK